MDLRGIVIYGDNADFFELLPDECVGLIYIDPPFNTGKVQRKITIKTSAVGSSESVVQNSNLRTGFGGKTYSTEIISEKSYIDKFDDYVGFLTKRLQEAHRVLKENGSIYLHIDYREVHRCRFLLDEIFGEENFLNEIIWAYDYGGRHKDRWPIKHNNILYYAKKAGKHIFNYDEIDRIPYMAPGLVGPEKAAKGKVPTDVWWMTIVQTNSSEKTGYPTQKPIKLLERIIRASSREGDIVLDFFAGSGTTGHAAIKLNRKFILVDNNPEAINVMKNRFKEYEKNIEFLSLYDNRKSVKDRIEHLL